LAKTLKETKIKSRALGNVRHVNPEGLIRLCGVLELVPVSKSTWWAGVKTGKFPKPVKLSERTTCWRASDILALIEKAANESVREG